MIHRSPISTLFPYTTLFRSVEDIRDFLDRCCRIDVEGRIERVVRLFRRGRRTSLPFRLDELHLLEEPEGIRPLGAELLLDLPHGLPARGDVLEHFALHVAVHGSEDRDEFSYLAHNLDSIHFNRRCRYLAARL